MNVRCPLGSVVDDFPCGTATDDKWRRGIQHSRVSVNSYVWFGDKLTATSSSKFCDRSMVLFRKWPYKGYLIYTGCHSKAVVVTCAVFVDTNRAGPKEAGLQWQFTFLTLL